MQRTSILELHNNNHKELDMETKIMALVPQEELDAIRAELAEVKSLLINIREDAPSTKSNDELLTSSQAAKRLKVTTRTLLKWRKAGIIKVRQVGRRILYRLSDINDLLERNLITSTK